MIKSVIILILIAAISCILPNVQANKHAYTTDAQAVDALSQALLDPSLLSQIDKFGNNISAVSDEALLESANPTFRQALKNLMVAATTTTVTINGTREKREEDVKNAKKLGPALEGVFARGMSNGFIRRRFLKKLVKSVRKDLLFGPLFPSSNNRGGGRGAVVAGGGFSNMLRRTLSMKQRRDLIDVLSNWDDDEYEHRNGHVLEKREELNDTSSFNTTLATVEDRGQGRRRKLINVLKAIGWSVLGAATMIAIVAIGVLCPVAGVILSIAPLGFVLLFVSYKLSKM